MASSKGGYDFEFVTDPPKALECPVCLLTLRDPHVISCCGQEFCQVCIERVQRDGKPCPLCNEPNFTTLLHKKLVREVNALVVRCPQKEMGCEWEGELVQVKQHLNPGAGPSSLNRCDYVMVKCTFQCGAHLRRRMIREHQMETCPKRPIEMQVASLMRKFEVITTENKIIKQELIEVKQMNQRQQEELVEVKQKNQRQHEELVEVKQALSEIKRKYSYLQTHTTPLPVPPFYFSVLNVDHYGKSNCIIYKSDPFYSHPSGYKMVVSVYPGGVYPSADTHLYLGVGIQNGEFDDQLQWPFKGKVTVQIYNITFGKWSNEKTIILNEDECRMDYVTRCLNIQTHGSWGDDFISHSQLQKHYITVGSDSVARFRVKKVELL